MILPALVALLTVAGLLLRGAWDLWAQSLLQLCVCLGLSLWTSGRVLSGYLPLPSRRVLVWTSACAALGALAYWTSPARGLCVPHWRSFLCALWLFPAMAALSKDQRFWIDEAVRLSAWVLAALAFYQRFALGDPQPAASLVNPNVYAGAVLLLLPLAAEKGDWLLAAALVWSLAWTRSVGAWLALGLALVATHKRASPARFWAGAATACVCAALLYGRLGSPDFLNRWWWWKAAAAMAADRPWTGWGPGAFPYVLPAYQARGPGTLLSLYAHQYPLQTAAEMGIPFALLWFSGLWFCASRGVSLKRFGVLAALIHSLWDYAPAVPAQLWLLSYFAASSISDGSEGVNIPSRRKLPALLLVAGLGLLAADGVRSFWQGHLCAVRGREALEASRWGEADLLLRKAAVLSPEDPEVPALRAALVLRRAEAVREPGPKDWLEAAAWLEKAARLDPYRPSLRTQLALAYRQAGPPAAPRTR